MWCEPPLSSYEDWDQCNFAITMSGWDLKLQKVILDLNYRIKDKRKSKKCKSRKSKKRKKLLW